MGVKYICTKQIAHYEETHNELGDVDYVVDEEEIMETTSLAQALRNALDFAEQHPDIIMIPDVFDVHGFYIGDGGVSTPNTPTYSFYVSVVRD